MCLVKSSIITIILIQLIERFGLRLRTRTANPLRRGQIEHGVLSGRVLENVLERLGPLDPVVQALESPQVLQKVQERGMCVGAVGGVRGSLVVDERVCCDEGGDCEGGDADARAGEVVGDVVLVRDAGECYAV